MLQLDFSARGKLKCFTLERKRSLQANWSHFPITSAGPHFHVWCMVAQTRSCTVPHPVHAGLSLEKTGSVFLCWAKSAFDGALISAK